MLEEQQRPYVPFTKHEMFSTLKVKLPNIPMMDIEQWLVRALLRMTQEELKTLSAVVAELAKGK